MNFWFNIDHQRGTCKNLRGQKRMPECFKFSWFLEFVSIASIWYQSGITLPSNWCYQVVRSEKFCFFSESRSPICDFCQSKNSLPDITIERLDPKWIGEKLVSLKISTPKFSKAVSVHHTKVVGQFWADCNKSISPWTSKVSKNARDEKLGASKKLFYGRITLYKIVPNSFNLDKLLDQLLWRSDQLNNDWSSEFC